MLTTLKKILGVKKKILLSVLHTFPHWHSRYGEETGFASKIGGSNPSKIHAVKSAVFFWEESCRKFVSGNYNLQIVHLEDTPKGKVYYPIMQCSCLHMQKARLSSEVGYLIIEGRKIDTDTVAGNEGLEPEDFIQFLDRFDGREFCIVHFTGFRY